MLVFTQTETSSAFPIFAGGFVLSLVKLFYSALFLNHFLKQIKQKPGEPNGISQF